MAIHLEAPDIRELKPHITVFGVGGAGGNAVNNMIETGLVGVDFVVSNTDAQALSSSKAERVIQMGLAVTEGLGAGSQPEVGRAAAEEVIDEIRDQLAGAHMVFITAGMGGGTGTGAAPVVARAARDMGILTVGVVTKPFQFEGVRRMRIAEAGITELQQAVDTLIVIPNQNLFRVADEKTTFADAFAMADQVLYSGVACITDLMVKEGLINLDFADVRSIMRGMGKAMMGTGEATADKRALRAAEAAIANPLLDDVCMKGARGLLISISGGHDMTLFEVDEAATRIREEVDQDANIILGATFDETLEGVIRVSVVATGIDHAVMANPLSETEQRIAAVAEKLRAEARARVLQSQPTPLVIPAANIGQTGLPSSTGATASRQPVTPVAVASSRTAVDATPSLPRIAVPSLIETQVPPVPEVNIHEEDISAASDVYAEDSYVSHAIPDPELGQTDLVADSSVKTHYEPIHDQELHAQELHNQEKVTAGEPLEQRALARPPRMPRIEDLPMQVQKQLATQRFETNLNGPMPAEQKRMTLLQRLAAVGLGANKGRPDAVPASVATQAPLAPKAPIGALALPQQPAAPQPRSATQGAAPSAVHNEYVRRPQTQAARTPAPTGESQSRPAPQGRGFEEDQLEIPAFLRRQAN